MTKTNIFKRYKITIVSLSLIFFTTTLAVVSWLVTELTKDYKNLLEAYKDNLIVFNSILFPIVLGILLTADYFRYSKFDKNEREVAFGKSIFEGDKVMQLALFEKYGNVFSEYILYLYPERYHELHDFFKNNTLK